MCVESICKIAAVIVCVVLIQLFLKENMCCHPEMAGQVLLLFAPLPGNIVCYLHRYFCHYVTLSVIEDLYYIVYIVKYCLYNEV